jgi:1-acyl-sn-glycerol-3-phosphate acyltransferase
MIPGPEPGASVPRAHSALAAGFGRLALTVLGWRIEGAFPDAPKMMIIVAPHTSNWDFVVGLMAKFALRLGCGYIAKQSLFWWPLGLFLRAMGGIPVNRAAAGDVVEDTARAYRERERLALVITPEGTRSRVAQWKSGFHRIARAAGVPIVLAVFDYGRKVVQIGPAFPATEDYAGDLAKIQSHISAKMARHPERYGQSRALQ